MIGLSRVVTHREHEVHKMWVLGTSRTYTVTAPAMVQDTFRDRLMKGREAYALMRERKD